MVYVLDACAMIAYLRGEPGAARVAEILDDQEDWCVAHVVNLCEVFYDFHRSCGEVVALAALNDLATAGVNERDQMSTALWQDAGALKANHRRVSLADCFAIALARKLEATILTADHHEFDPLALQGVCAIEFIR